jgi:uncharacterized protein YbbC (DUF1343 family)
MSTMQRVAPGLDELLETPELIGGRPWVLLSNQAAMTSELVCARAALALAGCGSPKRLFAPEHGLDGIAQDMEAVGHAVDPITGVEVRSLYGATPETLEPRAEDLDGSEVLVVDLPDIGTRYYTFAATMDAAMQACERAGLEVVVLDRPNPIGGIRREGGPVDAGFESFVSQLPTPVRHGLTLGEIALLLQRQRYPSLELTVVRCRGWRRSWWWDETGLPWVAPSPNMPTLETAALYPGLCLVEATNLSEGRGTTMPFQVVGAPWFDDEAVLRELWSLQIPGLGVRRTRFRPAFGKHAGEVCPGVGLHVIDRQAFEPVALGVRLLQIISRFHPEQFRWRAEPYEFVNNIPAIDLLTGSAAARELIESGDDIKPLLTAWAEYTRAFEADLDGLLLYHEDR